MLANPYFQKINTLYEKSSIEVEGKDFYLDILMGGDMKFCNLCLGWVNLYVIIPVHGIGFIKATRGQIKRLLHDIFHIGPDISPRLHIKPDSEAGGLIWVEGWYQGPYGKFHVIIFLSHILHWPFQALTFILQERYMNRQIVKINP